jgi:diaminohydroxyphosphoribosylaminopyrimidine deaminase / 5-amino-6-(5-phosphoribosylamino)uracil reductase
MKTPAEEHEIWMQRALDLARRGEGLTRPNPPVGAVLVRKGKVLGEGYHRKAGGPHAEVMAVRNAGGAGSVQGATAYVTLEPCSTYGRTPPCCELLIREGIKDVVIAARDPNPLHAGKGHRVLRRAGVRVVDGVLREQGEALIEPFAWRMKYKRPFVTLKLGVTLDGKIADADGASQWITGPAARRMVQEMRRRADAMVVGAETVRRDNPSLWPRPAKGRQPWRVVVSGSGVIPASARVCADEHATRTILATTASAKQKRLASCTRHGAEVWTMPGKTGRMPLTSVIHKLYDLDVLHVLCEGGGALAESLIREHLVDEMVWFIAPSLLGGGARPSVGGAGWTMATRPQWKIIETRPVGADVMIRARPARRKE